MEGGSVSIFYKSSLNLSFEGTCMSVCMYSFSCTLESQTCLPPCGLKINWRFLKTQRGFIILVCT